MKPEQRQQRARVAAMCRHRKPDDPELVHAQRAMKADRVEDYIRRVVDEAPPLSDEQRHRIAALLRPSPQTGDGRVA